MFLQTLFALSSLIPAITAFAPAHHEAVGERAVPSSAAYTRRTITISGGRQFTAEVFTPKLTSSESRYPGAIVIATDETRDRAFLIASRMSEIGVTVIMYTQIWNGTHRLWVFDAQAAVDSMRRRQDVRIDEIGVIAFEEATTVVPDLVKDTTLTFAIAASGDEYGREVTRRYEDVHAATLVVQGVDSEDPENVARVTGQTVKEEPTETAGPKPVDSKREGDDVALPPPPSVASPNVTVWPVSRAQLDGIGEPHSPLGIRVVSWVREQVHVTASAAQQQQTITIH
jgi:hypothetical protein